MIALLGLLVPTVVHVANATPEHGVPDLPAWVQRTESTRSERPEFTPIRIGDMVIDGESATFDQIVGNDGTLPAVNYEKVPGVLFLEMNGVTLRPTCGNGETANGALNCSPLVGGQPVTFPAYGNAAQQAAILQQVQAYFQDFDLTVVAERPPDWVPYTLAVIGGTGSLIGEQNGVCGIANLGCDGLKRNYVSLNFTNCGEGIIADIVGQETAHNWGLEHVTDPSDLLYPTANGGAKSFNDACMTITNAANTVTQCGYAHELHCAAAEGGEQNSYAELMGVFGPRTDDTVAPAIVDLQPASGTYPLGSVLPVTAKVEENSEFIAAKWTWVEGAPNPDFTTKCTNRVCDEYWSGLALWVDPNTFDFSFVNLVRPPVGTYTFKFEVRDAKGNASEQTTTIVIAADDTTSSSGSSGSEGSDGGGSATGDAGDVGSDESAGDETAPGDDPETEPSCACRSGRPNLAGWWLMLLILGPPRRMRRSSGV